ELERAILAKKPEEEMFATVRKQGMLTMKEDAIIKAVKGVIPFEEVNTLGGTFDLFDEEEAEPTPAPVAEAAPVALNEKGESVAKEPKAEPEADPKEKEIQI